MRSDRTGTAGNNALVSSINAEVSPEHSIVQGGGVDGTAVAVTHEHDAIFSTRVVGCRSSVENAGATNDNQELGALAQSLGAAALRASSSFLRVAP